ncbi:MAG: hypothetical protein NT166_20460 [Candidatus Aminicenantes bacterium]|nr:hypothetical protein [Candidatus Aminicenantes bacterium]
MKKIGFIILAIAVLMVGTSPLYLQGQSLNLKVGGFYPAMESDLWAQNLADLAFDKQDMLGVYWGAELEMEMGRYFTGSLESGYYNQDIFSVYRDYEHEDGSPINQDFSLRITSFEAGFKLYPLGYRNVFNPYIGGGVGAYFWKYIQGGEFIDFNDYSIYEGEAYTRTITPGFNARAGFVYRFKRTMGIQFEAKYTYLKGQLSGLFDASFDKLDLSGVTFTMGVNFFLR